MIFKSPGSQQVCYRLYFLRGGIHDSDAQGPTPYTSCCTTRPDFPKTNRPHSILRFYNQTRSCSFSVLLYRYLLIYIARTDPQTRAEYRAQFVALCEALKLDPTAPDILATLRDPTKISWSAITNVIETEALGPHGTFRGCLSEDWLARSPDPMAWQRSGGFARGLRAHGVRSIIIGDLSEEWYLYSIAHPIHGAADIAPNLARYFPADVVAGLMDAWKKLPDGAGEEEAQRLFGEILSCGQVHLPVRLLARDLHAAGFPVLRYTIEWTPEQARVEGECLLRTAMAMIAHYSRLRDTRNGPFTMGT